MSLALLFHYLLLNMFRMLIHPSSGACDLFYELFNGLYCSGSMCVGVTLWFGWGSVVSLCRLKPGYGYIKLVSLYSTKGESLLFLTRKYVILENHHVLSLCPPTCVCACVRHLNISIGLPTVTELHISLVVF